MDNLVNLEQMKSNVWLNKFLQQRNLSREDFDKFQNQGILLDDFNNFLMEKDNDPLAVSPEADDQLSAPENYDRLQQVEQVFAELKNHDGLKDFYHINEELDEVAYLSAMRSLSVSQDEINAENLQKHLKTEGNRVAVEYFAALYGATRDVKDEEKYKSTYHAQRLADIDELVAQGKTKQEIYHALFQRKGQKDFEPSPQQEKLASQIVAHSNIIALKSWIKNAGKKVDSFLSKVEAFEKKHPFVNMAAGLVTTAVGARPVYMAYRMTMAVRGLYKQVKSYDDCASVRDVIKKHRSELIKNNFTSFARAMPGGSTILAAKAMSSMLSKQYWQSVGHGFKGMKQALHMLRESKGRQGWKELWNNGGRTIATVGGTVLAVGGAVGAGYGIYSHFDSIQPDAVSGADLPGSGLDNDAQPEVQSEPVNVLQSQNDSTLQNINAQNDEPANTTENVAETETAVAAEETITENEVKAEEPVQPQPADVKAEEPVQTQAAEAKTEEPIPTQSSEVKTEESVQSVEAETEGPVQTQAAEAKTEEPAQPQPSETKTEEATQPQSAETKTAEAAKPAEIDLNNLTPRQQHDIEMLLKRYPAAANKLINDGQWHSSAELAKMWQVTGENGLSDDLKRQMTAFAGEHFDAAGHFITADGQIDVDMEKAAQEWQKNYDTRTGADSSTAAPVAEPVANAASENAAVADSGNDSSQAETPANEPNSSDSVDTAQPQKSESEVKSEEKTPDINTADVAPHTTQSGINYTISATEKGYVSSYNGTVNLAQSPVLQHIRTNHVTDEAGTVQVGNTVILGGDTNITSQQLTQNMWKLHVNGEIADDIYARQHAGEPITDVEQQYLDDVKTMEEKYGIFRNENGEREYGRYVQGNDGKDGTWSFDDDTQKTAETAVEYVTHETKDGIKYYTDENGDMKYNGVVPLSLKEEAMLKPPFIHYTGDSNYQCGDVVATDKSTLNMMANAALQKIHSDDSVYRDLQSRSEAGEVLSDVEKSFCQGHQETLSKWGLTHNDDGQLVRREFEEVNVATMQGKNELNYTIHRDGTISNLTNNGQPCSPEDLEKLNSNEDFVKGNQERFNEVISKRKSDRQAGFISTKDLQPGEEYKPVVDGNAAQNQTILRQVTQRVNPMLNRFKGGR